MSVVLVTGTSTEVGKTLTTAALVRASMDRGNRVGVVKIVQTGADSGEPRDIETIERLSGTPGSELVRLDDPLAPDSAARLRGTDLPGVRTLADRVAHEAALVDVAYVEGSGGVVVRLDREGGTLLTLGCRLTELGTQVRVVVVTSLLLGTLNHTELTVGAIRAAGLEPVGLVFGDVPAAPLGLAERVNLDDLPRVTGLPVLGAIPHGAGRLSPAEFRRTCASWMRRPV